MSRLIQCTKLQKEAEGLTVAPYPGELGKKIYAEISREAWQQWITHQTMMINEYRLSMVDAKAREFLRVEMEKFLFGGGSEAPAGFVPKSAD